MLYNSTENAGSGGGPGSNNELIKTGGPGDGSTIVIYIY